MWEKSRSLSKIILLTSSLVLLSSFSCLASGSYTPQTEPQTNIVMSMTQYNQLQAIISRQYSRLEMLQQKLTQLKNNSGEASKELTESQNELSKLRSELTATQKSLENAKISLTQAEETLQRQEESLQTLTKEIKSMEHKQTVTRRQRDVWAAIAALSLGGVIARK